MRDNDYVPPAAEQAHYVAGLDWEAERDAMLTRSERRAWTVASAASVIAIAAVIGLATLAPFRRNVPYLFALEKATGNVEFVGAADERRVMAYQELLDKHWAQRYVVARESYNYRLLQADYDTVLGMSADEVGRDFAKLYEGANARDTKYGAGAEIKVAVLSVQLSQNAAGSQAFVRYAKTMRRIDAETSDLPQYYVATIAYEYKPSMAGREKDLLANPLGFKVTSWRADPEMAPVAAPATRNAGQ